MSEHRATISWSRGNAEFTYETYPRDHIWRFDGVEVVASAAPAFKGNGERVDPEEGFVAAVSSCHMLTFLAIAARRKVVVDAYEDEAVGHLEKNEKGKLAVTRVELRPRIRFGGAAPSAEELDRLHEMAHENCFIAQSVLTEITVSARD